jgi:hypothetical protein
MTTADTASIITAWPEEGLSYNDALKRAPMWDDCVNPKPREEFNIWLCVDTENGLETIPLPPGEESNKWPGAAIQIAPLRPGQERNKWRQECDKWLRKLVENGLVMLQGRDAQNDQPIQIPPSMDRHLHFDAITELMHGLGRTFYDLRVFPADELKAAPTSSVATGLDAFRTGAPGRPSAADFIRTEVKRRIGAREVVPRRGDLEAYSNVMWDWYEKERHKFNPPGPEVKSPGSVKNMIRPVWNCALSNVQN